MRTVFLKDTRRRKLAELVADHILGHEHGDKRLAVVHQKRVADKIRRHHRLARPRFHRLLRGRRIHLVDFLEKMRFDEGSFF